MEKGLLNLRQAYRTTQRSDYCQTNGDSTDSVIGMRAEEEDLRDHLIRPILPQKSYDDNHSDSGISDSDSIIAPETHNDAPNGQHPRGIPAKGSDRVDTQCVDDAHKDADVEIEMIDTVSSPTSSRYADSLTCSSSPGTLSSARSETIDTIDQRKEHVLNRLMIKFYEMFDASGGITSRGNGDSSSSKGASPTSSQSQGSGRVTKKKRKSDEMEDGENDEQDEEANKRPIRPRKRKNSGDSMKRKLACPFFKHNPQKYQVRTCQGPGWDSVHRIKLVMCKNKFHLNH